MRRLLTFALSLTASATVLVAVPTITPGASAAPRPVEPTVEQVPLSGDQPRALRSPLLTGKRFSVMGVTWTPDPAVGEVDVDVRTRTGDAWSAWEHVAAEGDDAPDDGTADTRRRLRAGSSPVWTGPSDGVQVSVRTRSGAAPRNVKIELVDPGTSAADRLPAAPSGTAHAAAVQPEIITRAQWGADESMRRGDPGDNATVEVGFVHHTASSNDYTAEQAAAMVRGIYAYHVKSNGWSDIGYNFLVDRYGRAYEGRAGSIERHVVGAHTGGFNADSFGVSLLGDFSTVPPSDETMSTLSKVLAWKLGSAYRDPRGTAVLTSAGGGTSKHRAGAQVVFDVVSGHRDAGNTSCPGATTYARLPALRAAVAEDLGANLVDPGVSGPTRIPVGSTGPLVLSAGTLQDLPWTATVTDSTGALLRVSRGTGGQAALTWDLTDAAGRPVEPGAYFLRLSGDAAGVVPYLRTVVVGDPPCKGRPLDRAKCQTRLRTARR